MEMEFNNQIDFDSIDITEWKSENSLLDAFEKEYLSFQSIGREDMSTGDMLDTDVDYGSQNINEIVNEQGNVRDSPKQFEIAKDTSKRRE